MNLSADKYVHEVSEDAEMSSVNRYEVISREEAEALCHIPGNTYVQLRTPEGEVMIVFATWVYSEAEYRRELAAAARRYLAQSA